MKRILKAGLWITFLCMGLCGCAVPIERVEMETGTLSFNNFVMDEAFEEEQTSVSEIIKLDNEPFSIVCTYDTRDYPLAEWRVTSNKNIYMDVCTVGLPSDYSVYVEHVHADVILKSTSPSIDGITQDSMDDSDHRTPSKGFPIKDDVSYRTIFAIEGYTDQFYKLWGYAFGSSGGMYGASSSSYERLTEKNIRKAGAYAEKLVVVYDLVISTPQFPEGYVTSVYSEVMIPLVGEVSELVLYGDYKCKENFNVPIDGKDGETLEIPGGSLWRCKDYNKETGIVKIQKDDVIITLPYETLLDKFYVSGN